MSPRQSVDYWIQVGDEFLADGEWHDGLELVEKMRAAIPPGIAIRRAEETRARASRAEKRVVEVSENRLVSIGRRSIVTAHINSRMRFGSWEIRPWPMSRNEWKAGGWEIRDLRVSRMALPDLARHFHVSTERLKAMIMQEPQLDHVMRGRWLYLMKSELPTLEERVKQYQEGSPTRRSAGSRERWEREVAEPPTEISVTQLARQAGISPRTGNKLRAANPQLPWIEHGSKWHSLPLSAVPAWNLVVELYKRDTLHRRTTAMLDGRRRKGRAQ